MSEQQRTATICTDCDGRGWRTVIRITGMTSDGKAHTVTSDTLCRTCNGSGNGSEVTR